MMINIVILFSLLISGTLGTTISFDPTKLINDHKSTFIEYQKIDCDEKESVNLSNLELKKLPKNVIKSQTIQNLILANNSITDIPWNIINDITSLECFNLANNLIPFEKLFTYSHDRLKTLILRDQVQREETLELTNTIVPAFMELDTRSLKFPNVLNLDLSGVNFATFRNDFNFSFPRLENLYLNDRPVIEVMENVFDVLPSSLRTFHLRYNNLNRLNFPYLNNVQELYLDGNPLKSISEHVLYSNTLHTLSLSNCNLWTIDSRIFSHIPNLQRLDLSSNIIDEIPQMVLRNTPSLEILILSKNRLSEFPNFDYLPQLQDLILNYNRIEGIRWPIRRSSLRKVFLRGNRIKTISNVAFSQISHLYLLDLSENELTTLPYEWSLESPRQTLQSLEYLYLNDNRFTTIADMSLQSFPNLQHLFIKGNIVKSIDDKELLTFPEMCTVYVV